MTDHELDIVFLGLTVTSTWGNGHATTYRALLKELRRQGHRVTFLERDVPWYAAHRELNHLPYGELHLYSSLEELRSRHAERVRTADAVIVGSYVPDGIAVGGWVTSIARGVRAFYDIDTPVTLANLEAGTCEYLSHSLCQRYDLYLSFTGGPTLDYIEKHLGSPAARALYCSVDPMLYFPEVHAKIQQKRWDIAYLGTYAPDRQPGLEKLLVRVAREHREQRFAVAGPQYPESVSWPENVERIEHLPAREHREFYNAQAFTLNLTRRDMVKAGYSPSVRLFEAAACGTPILTDVWPGLETIFTPGKEILPVRSAEEVAAYLRMPGERREEVGIKARKRVLRFHTAAVRARQLSGYVTATFDSLARSNIRSRILLQNSEARAAF